MEDFVIYNTDVNQEDLKRLNIFISNNTVVQDGAKIYFNSCLTGDSVIYSTAVIHSNSTINNSIVRGDCVIFSSRVEDSELDTGCVIGPFAHIKDKCEFGKNCKVGNFAVVKNSIVADNVTIAHLAMIENAEIGKNSVLSSGVVFSTNGETILIGDNVKVGANSSLVAPLEIQDEAVIDVNSIITKNIGFKEFASNKPKQINAEIK